MTLFRRIIPRPLLSLLLWVTWLLLNNTWAFGHVLLGLVLAISIPLITSAFWNPQPDMKRPLKMLRFIMILLLDIVLANLQVARRILGPARSLRPAFIEYPLDLKEDFTITVLASTISLTPGTVSAQLSADRTILMIHTLDVEDEQALIQEIKSRYETPLKEIFEC